jgi:hypothetical protein
MPPTLAVQLTYFKQTGKFRTEASFPVYATRSLSGIWDDVQGMRDRGQLPGLCEGAGRDYIILINVPGHESEHPHLLRP